jgi:hypothetical protein
MATKKLKKLPIGDESVKKFFNTAGPVNPEDHYCLPLSERLNEQEVRTLVEDKKYFILHAPRQTGKTSVMVNFAKMLNAEEKYTALYVNVEAAQAARSNFREGLLTILKAFKAAIDYTFGQDDPGMRYFDKEITIASISGNELFDFLQFWAQNSPKPIILFIDEIDSLIGDTLISVLRQLRAGYTNRPQAFPQSLCLIGVRDVRDYRIWSDVEQQIILGGSAFNIKAKSLRLGDFTKKEVKELYLQHTRATGQKFDKDALDYAFELTQGQPWLVNALAYEACFEMITDRNKPIIKETIERAKEALIKRRDTHIDALVDKLQEPRVRTIVDAVINGARHQRVFKQDDLSYVRDLGILSQTEMKIANPIYQEIFPRELTSTIQEEIDAKARWYQDKDKSMNMSKLMKAFTLFYRENSEILIRELLYHESGPHLLLMAFLQRVINGGGRITREYALGRDRVDLLLVWPQCKKGEQRVVIEIKVWKGEKAYQLGLKQTAGYMRTSDATEGHLVIFDRSINKSWDEKIYQRKVKVGGKTITVWGM